MYEFISEVLSIINDYDAFDINCLYQSYIATDFSIMDGEVKFEGGKNNRDILGSYYTQEEFAYEITQKAIEEYLENNIGEEVNELKIADYSCGGGAFLVASCRICRQKGISADIYGYDVDPIAIMITRHRLRFEESSGYKILLGNPLLITKNDIDVPNKEMVINIYHEIYDDEKLSNFIYKHWGDKKMILTFPNIKVTDVNGNLVYMNQYLDIKPYYVRIHEK